MLPHRDPSVIFQKLGDGAVLFAPGQELYFGLNEVGAQVWQLLPPSTASLDDLCAQISAVYPDVPLEIIRCDVSELLSELERERLVAQPSNDRRADPAP